MVFGWIKSISKIRGQHQRSVSFAGRGTTRAREAPCGASQLSSGSGSRDPATSVGRSFFFFFFFVFFLLYIYIYSPSSSSSFFFFFFCRFEAKGAPFLVGFKG